MESISIITDRIIILSKKILIMLMASIFFNPTFDAKAVSQREANVSADEFIRSMSMQVFHAVEKSKSKSNHVVSSILKKTLIPGVDVNRMARIVVARDWRNVPPGKWNQFIGVLESGIIENLRIPFSFNNPDFEVYKSNLSSRNADVIIRTKITPKNSSDEYFVSYRMGLSDSGWRIYDIGVNDSWLISLLRNVSSSKENGVTAIDSLIAFIGPNGQHLSDKTGKSSRTGKKIQQEKSLAGRRSNDQISQEKNIAGGQGGKPTNYYMSISVYEKYYPTTYTAHYALEVLAESQNEARQRIVKALSSGCLDKNTCSPINPEIVRCKAGWAASLVIDVELFATSACGFSTRESAVLAVFDLCRKNRGAGECGEKGYAFDRLHINSRVIDGNLKDLRHEENLRYSNVPALMSSNIYHVSDPRNCEILGTMQSSNRDYIYAVGSKNALNCGELDNMRAILRKAGVGEISFTHQAR